MEWVGTREFQNPHCWADPLCFLQFGQTQRFIGEAGSTQRMSNLKNTIVGCPSTPSLWTVSLIPVSD
jgi:hypothetical protein